MLPNQKNKCYKYDSFIKNKKKKRVKSSTNNLEDIFNKAMKTLNTFISIINSKIVIYK